MKSVNKVIYLKQKKMELELPSSEFDSSHRSLSLTAKTGASVQIAGFFRYKLYSVENFFAGLCKFSESSRTRMPFGIQLDGILD